MNVVSYRNGYAIHDLGDYVRNDYGRVWFFWSKESAETHAKFIMCNSKKMGEYDMLRCCLPVGHSCEHAYVVE